MGFENSNPIERRRRALLLSFFPASREPLAASFFEGMVGVIRRKKSKRLVSVTDEGVFY